MYVWQTLKVFVSSTFLDLELERDQLGTVFADIKQQLFARRLSLVPYDLRWRERHSQQSLVKWCIEMVKQCNYFIAILGDRYGWRPDEDAFGNANSENLSVTEMEINQALACISRQRRFFCIASGESNAGDVSREDRNAVRALKQRLIKSGEQVYEFGEISEMLPLVRNQLMAMIDREFPPEQKLALQSYSTSDALQDIVEHKTREFVGRASYLDRLEQFATDRSRANYLALYGMAGTGKTALIAKFIRNWQTGAHSDVPVIAHFMGMDANSRQVNQVVRAIGDQLRQNRVITNTLAADFSELRTQVRQALEKTTAPLLLIFDGLDEIEENGHDLLWLPRNIPVGVRVIITTRPVLPWPNLQQYPRLTTLPLQPLDQQEIVQLIANYSLAHQLNLTQEDIDLLQKRAAGNPLYLKVALEEILSGGIAVGQLATSIDSLFEQILQRLARQYGEQIIWDYLGLLAASRGGLTESELQELIQHDANEQHRWTDDIILIATHQLASFIISRGGVLHFFHPEFERTLKQRLGRSRMRDYHRRLAHYFKQKGCAYDRALLELCYQQQWAEEYRGLLATLTDLEFLQAKCQAHMGNGLAEDFARALDETAVPLPGDLQVTVAANIVANRRILQLLAKAFAIDRRFILRYPRLVFQCLWNRCYWHDCPESSHHYEFEPKSAPQQKPVVIYPLMEYWQAQQPDRVWIKSRRPLQPHLDSPLRKIFKGHDYAVCRVDLSHDRKRIASGAADGTVRIWDSDSGECLFVIGEHGKTVRSVAFSPDGRLVASGADDWLVLLWDALSGECMQILEGHQEPVTCMAWRNNRELVSGSEDRTVRLWDVTSGRCLQTFSGHSEAVLTVAVQPQGQLIAAAGKDKEIRVWSVGEEHCRHLLTGHRRLVTALDFAGEAGLLASGDKQGEIRLWQLDDERCINVLLQHTAAVVCLLFQGSDAIFSVGEDNLACLWNLAQGQPDRRFFMSRRHAWEVTCAAVSQDQRELVCGSRQGSVSFWDFYAPIDVDTLHGHEAPITAVSFGQNGDLLASGSVDKSVRIWDIGGECRRNIEHHDAEVASVALSDDQTKVAVATEHGTIYVWNSKTGELIHRLYGHKGLVSSVSFHNGDSRIVSTGYHDNSFRVWTVAQGECLAVLSGHEKWIEHVAFNHDSSKMVSGSRDKTVRIWSIGDATCLRVLRGHDRSATRVAFSVDGQCVASGCLDGSLRIWSAETGACLMIFQGHESMVIDLAFSQDGMRLYSSARDKTTRIWDTTTGQCVEIIDGKVDCGEMARENLPLFVVARDWEMAIVSKDDGQTLALFPDALEPGKFIRENILVGRGKTAPGYIYVLELQNGVIQ